MKIIDSVTSDAVSDEYAGEFTHISVSGELETKNTTVKVFVKIEGAPSFECVHQFEDARRVVCLNLPHTALYRVEVRNSVGSTITVVKG